MDTSIRETIQQNGVIEITGDCKGCDQCVQYCPADAISLGVLGGRHVIDHDLCVNCGQCLVHCPFDRIQELSMVDYVKQAIEDPQKHVVIQFAPSVRVGLGESFGMPEGTPVEGKMLAAARRIGIDTVHDTCFGADMTIMEEGFELVGRVYHALGLEVDGVTASGPLPQFTSCCPGWVSYAEKHYPDMLDHLSSARSPMMMQGAVTKVYFAEKMGIDPANIFNVAVMPCTAKKFECTRPEFIASGFDDQDAVITTREYAQMIKDAGVDFASLPDEGPDSLMGESTGAGIIFGNTGGVMEAALRSAYEIMSGDTLVNVDITDVRGQDFVRSATIPIPIKELGGEIVDVKVGIVSGSKNVDQLMQDVRDGKSDYVFIEVMNCPQGCINGGGQPITRDL